MYDNLAPGVWPQTSSERRPKKPACSLTYKKCVQEKKLARCLPECGHDIVRPTFQRNVQTTDLWGYWSLTAIHYNDVIMGAMASQITAVSIVYSTICSGADQRKHQSSASLPFVRGIHRWPVNSPHKGPVTPKMFPIWWRVIMLNKCKALVAWSLFASRPSANIMMAKAGRCISGNPRRTISCWHDMCSLQQVICHNPIFKAN